MAGKGLDFSMLNPHVCFEWFTQAGSHNYKAGVGRGNKAKPLWKPWGELLLNSREGVQIWQSRQFFRQRHLDRIKQVGKSDQKSRRRCREWGRVVKETRTAADSLCSYFNHHCVYTLSPSAAERRASPVSLPPGCVKSPKGLLTHPHLHFLPSLLAFLSSRLQF